MRTCAICSININGSGSDRSEVPEQTSYIVQVLYIGNQQLEGEDEERPVVHVWKKWDEAINSHTMVLENTYLLGHDYFLEYRNAT